MVPRTFRHSLGFSRNAGALAASMFQYSLNFGLCLTGIVVRHQGRKLETKLADERVVLRACQCLRIARKPHIRLHLKVAEQLPSPVFACLAASELGCKLSSFIESFKATHQLDHIQLQPHVFRETLHPALKVRQDIVHLCWRAALGGLLGCALQHRFRKWREGLAVLDREGLKILALERIQPPQARKRD